MPFAPDTAVVWTEIPVSDLDAAVAFYNAVFDYGLTIQTTGPNPMAFIPTKDGKGTAGHLYPGAPGAGSGPTVHLQVQDSVEAARERCVAAGGSSEGPIVEMPFGRWAYASDPDGNSIGLFEMAAS